VSSGATGTVTTAARRTRRLLRPPLTGDGLLLVGFVEGVVGWPLSWLVATRGVTPAGLDPVATIVGLWAVLTAVIVAVGWTTTLPAVRQNNAWVVWGVLNLIATGVNVLGLLAWLGVAETMPAAFLQFAFWHPWLAVFGGGYLILALLDRDDRRITPVERVGYGLAGVASLLLLAGAFATGPNTLFVLEWGFQVGAVLHLAPMGFDLAYDTLR